MDVWSLQETEKGMLFARKSRWKDFTRGIKQHVAIIGSTLSLWKTSIQTIEARHGEHPSQCHRKHVSPCPLRRHTSIHVYAWQAVNFKTLLAWRQVVSMLHTGSNVSLTLYFLRFAMGVNVAIAAFWLAGTVIPFVISPPSTFSWQYFKAYRPTDLLQGYGLHNTFLLYGGSCCMGMVLHRAIPACMLPY